MRLKPILIAYPYDVSNRVSLIFIKPSKITLFFLLHDFNKLFRLTNSRELKTIDNFFV